MDERGIHTAGSRLFEETFEQPVQHFARHLARKHGEDLNLPRAPDQRDVGDDQSLGYERQKSAQSGDMVVGIVGDVSER